jgi:hypothetical protein
VRKPVVSLQQAQATSAANNVWASCCEMRGD